MTDTDQHEATPRAELERQIMDPNIPKNEREWWAANKIERLTAALIAVAASRRLSAAHHIARAALEPKP